MENVLSTLHRCIENLWRYIKGEKYPFCFKASEDNTKDLNGIAFHHYCTLTHTTKNDDGDDGKGLYNDMVLIQDACVHFIK